MADSPSIDQVAQGEEIIPLSATVVESSTDKCVDNAEKSRENRPNIGLSRNRIKKPRKGWKKYVGVFSAFAAGYLISVSALAVKMLQKYHPFNTSLWRYGANLPLIIGLLSMYSFRKKSPCFRYVRRLTSEEGFKWNDLLNLLGNGVLAWLCVNLRFYAFQYLTAADTVLIAYSSPVFVIFFAHFCLGERCGFASVFLSFVAVIGVAVISRPPLLTGSNGFDSNILTGTLLAVGSMLSHTCICIFIRKIRRVHFSIVIFVHGICGFILSCGAAGSIGQILTFPQGTTDWIWATIVVISGFGTQVLLVFALKFEEAAPVSLILCLQIILAFVWQFIFLDTIPDMFSLIGSTLILIAVSLAIFRKWLFSLPVDSRARKQCWILLK